VVHDSRLAVPTLEDEQALRDAVVSVHNAALLTFMNTGAYRFIGEPERAFVHPARAGLRATSIYPHMAFPVLVKTMDDEKMTDSRRKDDQERETPLHDYVGGHLSNPEPKKTSRKEETDTSSGTGARER